jgi:hypothetical protein
MSQSGDLQENDITAEDGSDPAAVQETNVNEITPEFNNLETETSRAVIEDINESEKVEEPADTLADRSTASIAEPDCGDQAQ